MSPSEWRDMRQEFRCVVHSRRREELVIARGRNAASSELGHGQV